MLREVCAPGGEEDGPVRQGNLARLSRRVDVRDIAAGVEEDVEAERVRQTGQRLVAVAEDVLLRDVVIDPRDRPTVVEVVDLEAVDLTGHSDVEAADPAH